MIEEAYVSFETAKLLKEKGFDCSCKVWYSEYTSQFGGEKYISIEFDNHNKFNENYKFICYAPTLQMAMKWLREVHHIHIEINWDKGNQLYSFQIWKPGEYQPEISSLDLWRIYKDDNYLGEWNYEEAVESALKYVLENLI